MRLSDLVQVLDGVLPPAAGSETILVGPELSDDAAVVRLPLDPGGAESPNDPRLVLTTDTIAPIVDEPEAFGAIAAANALSDVWAMGGRPLWALNLAFFPDRKLPLEILQRIMLGARDKCREAGVQIVGGHTVRNDDLKFGLAVTGAMEGKRARHWANTRALPGQLLVLSKGLGTGILGTAIKRGDTSAAETAAATASMTRLNQDAARFARELGATACTDVTGFGLLGHLRNLLRGSRLQAALRLRRLPVLPGAIEHLRAGRWPGGSQANLEAVEPNLIRRYASTDERAFELTRLAADAQTSGGLLVALSPDNAERLLENLRGTGHQAAIIGELHGARPDEVGRIELA
ncbi:selenide, water dikinase SelD [Pseudenhygromyxa sp. WMMC2535]|uniref:selenide, water dikinase SelD n=1 Tax=Pseudenhygromyxa sp. WMMC2535 TaxID=2712867 RepID=UPI0015572A14|nr:selenide, water dikinase SelD [Pseudenhygromyxa sp. WMMC2535]NVB40889.1 selenide, water dikinase SelD [Pseudenhygromyxa sp. WMMC2535]